MKTCLLINHQSGSSLPYLEAVEGFVDRIGGKLCPIDEGCRIETRVQEALEEGVERIIVAGGDGSISQVVNSLAPDFSRVEIAILPLGTGNDLARSLGIEVGFFESACELAYEGTAVEIDAVKVVSTRTSYFVNVASGGIGGNVAIEVRPEDKRRWGAFAYWVTAAYQFLDLNQYRVRIALDKETVLEKDVHGVAVANGCYLGGGFTIAPQAILNDGLLDITVVPVTESVLELVSSGVGFALGTSNGNGIEMHRARRVEISAEPDMPFSVDGEVREKFDGTFEVLPRAVRFVAGENPLIETESPD
jgi:YegS/Rv2252/BmrU family lipid kinase